MKKYRNLWIAAALCLMPFQAFAQSFCGSDFTLAQMSHSEKEMLREGWYEFYTQLSKSTSSLYTVPVVVHIIHNGGSENISDAQVIQGIQDLNDSFENVGYYDQGTGVNVDIEFCLAQRDPDGMPTTGINRVQDPLTVYTMETEDITLKDLSRWEPLDYINIWVVLDICSNSIGCGVAGYAFFPSSHGDPEDGIVVEAPYFGGSQSNSSVTSHEMGHYLGLYHTFQGGCPNNDCLLDGDELCDTPPDNTTAYIPCASSSNSCSTDTDSGFSTDQDDMHINYMDYSDLECYSAFTDDQKSRMQFSLLGPRLSLLSSLGCLDPCYSPLTADYTTASNTVNVQDIVTFINTSTGASNYEWYIDGVLISSTEDLMHAFMTEGTYEVLLLAYNSDPNCISELSMEIVVVCPVNASYAVSNFYPLPGENVSFTNTSASSSSYEWYVDGVLYASTQNFDFSSLTIGFYQICLTSTNGICEDSFCLNVYVTDTPPDCDATFIKTLGSDSLDEEAHKIVTNPNGGYYVSGIYGEESFISYFDDSDILMWTRYFDPGIGTIEWHHDLIIDSDFNLLGTGRSITAGGTTENGFIYKYNPNTNSMVWTSNFQSNGPSSGTEILELSPGADYMLSTQFFTFSGLGCDGGMLTVERNTGNIIDDSFMDIGACEGVIDIELYNGELYGTGRYTYAGGGQDKMRTVLTKFNVDGTEDWTGTYLNNTTSDFAREYGRNLVIANDEMVVSGHGDPDGTSPSDIDLHLYKTDMSGNLLWARYIDIVGAVDERPWAMFLLPDGYVIGGFYELNNVSTSYVMKTDLDGNMLWAKKFSTLESRFYQIILKDGFIYAVGYIEDQGDRDLFIVKMSIDGEVLANDCEIEDIAVSSTLINNPFEQVSTSNQITEAQSLLTLNPTLTDINLEETVLCQADCDDDCSCPLMVALSDDDMICDSGTLTESLVNLSDSCEFTDVSWTHIGSSAFSSTDSTFTLTSTSAGMDMIIVEASNDCYIVTDTVIINTVSTGTNVLDLGPDISICENGVFILDAGPGFNSYEWQDAYDGQTYTAYSAGVYEVTVTDTCGIEQTDQLTIDILANTIIDIPDTLICAEDVFTYTLSGFDEYIWFPDDGSIDCLTCPSVTIEPVEGIYTVQASTIDGCVSVDSFYLSIDYSCCIDSTLDFNLDIINPSCYEYADASFMVNLTSGAYPPYSYSLDSVNWQSDALFDELSAGTYLLYIKNADACVTEQSVLIEDPNPILVSAGEDVTIDILEDIQLQGTTDVINIGSLYWLPSTSLSCSDCLDPIANPDVTTEYILTVVNSEGCENSDTVIVTVETDYDIYIPNAFTPDGSGTNDVFTIYGTEIIDEIVVFRIFNRWGELVFNSENFPPNDPSYGWDGRYKDILENSGVFVYLIEARFLDGKRIQYKGNVTLLR